VENAAGCELLGNLEQAVLEGALWIDARRVAIEWRTCATGQCLVAGREGVWAVAG
jgi:hypothetical protein